MRFKLYALSYKALSYAEIQKDLNKEIYKENKTEKGRDWKSSTNIYKSRISGEFISADSFPENRKKAARGGDPGKGRAKRVAESELGREIGKSSKKIFRNSADFAFPRRILIRKRKTAPRRFRSHSRSALANRADPFGKTLRRNRQWQLRQTRKK